MAGIAPATICGWKVRQGRSQAIIDLLQPLAGYGSFNGFLPSEQNRPGGLSLSRERDGVIVENRLTHGGLHLCANRSAG